MKVAFPLIGQRHQTLHALPVALEISARHPDVAVHVSCLTVSHLELARSLATLYPEARVQFDLLPISQRLRRRIEKHGLRVVDRLIGLFASRHYFQGFDAIIVPEATSLQLRRMGVRRPKMIWTGHGAGDRAIGFARHLGKFDFLLVPGRKVEQRMLEKGIIRPDAYHRGTYAKFDLVRRMDAKRPKLFNNNRPTILYNPHFVRRLSSWPEMGHQILKFFAGQDRYNLVFAPHFRLFDNRREEGEALKRQYGHLPHMLIDPGSHRSIDMTYTMGADLYLGDVSSQVAEFMIRPRPCLFLNAHHVKWRGDPDYQFWTLGPVTENVLDLGDKIENAFKTHPRFLEAQRQYVLETFETLGDEPTAPAAADAIVDFLKRAA
ncbi:sensor domain-containing protein [Gluconobacter kondonii]|uniref:sensor domain-containing protein n=1 Tax=Gluconobacter kondonii TaxID=941463 RepID=UPI001B8CAD69|nr:sensor domain-containing protein [Gluconobacter kondonii]MBS1054083.1 sensor domain-containing protein [Gluconobacter kondonii]MBS1055195.1 sensor domain-containing protein [Gluconobacter kondonii]MBS1077022.1 sensor domain-containing protein [Gluconobacter kondonii]